ncbi:hypothetical protein FSPOR_6462 [Fusarium sporotrichioides]|uniref:Uncharacterized protein n=1 Tax=Fusarium sporotrichioides TaxID=5514 RepID=A0A395S3P2_FUSSP|nr:hypothetical protein FSPOR_6462 [Fusarium sporotrichioides]
MKFTTGLVCAAGVSHVTATGGVGLPVCIAACLPLIWNPIAYGACTTGCSVAAVPEDEAKVNPHFQPDGSVVFEKETAQCAAVCKGLVADRLAYSACLIGCAGAAKGEKN